MRIRVDKVTPPVHHEPQHALHLHYLTTQHHCSSNGGLVESTVATVNLVMDTLPPFLALDYSLAGSMGKAVLVIIWHALI